jgi:hypothetical protein
LLHVLVTAMSIMFWTIHVLFLFISLLMKPLISRTFLNKSDYKACHRSDPTLLNVRHDLYSSKIHIEAYCTKSDLYSISDIKSAPYINTWTRSLLSMMCLYFIILIVLFFFAPNVCWCGMMTRLDILQITCVSSWNKNLKFVLIIDSSLKYARVDIDKNVPSFDFNLHNPSINYKLNTKFFQLHQPWHFLFF